MTSRRKYEAPILSRRTLLRQLGLAPFVLRSAPLRGALFAPPDASSPIAPFPFADIRFTPRYPAQSPLTGVLALVAPGSDEYTTERYAAEIDALLARWSADLKKSPDAVESVSSFLCTAFAGPTLTEPAETPLRSGFGIDAVRRRFSSAAVQGRDAFLREIHAWLESAVKIETAEFEIYSIGVLSDTPLAVHAAIRYDLVAQRRDSRREERVGSWQVEWVRDGERRWKARKWEASEETLSIVASPGFIDVTQAALGGTDSYREQMLRAADYWRTTLDGAIGVDVYGNNGIAAGDYDNDGFDDLYVCQPSGLPNRLYRNRGDGTFEDVTEKAGVGVLDNTACALFADFDNRGLEDLLVVCSTGPLLFRNEGSGTFALKRDAFKFARPPQGSFTHAAVADYDRDGRLDIYFCLYMYYLGLDQYHYPVPYYDARNGPPNCLMHNEGNGKFVETTEAAGLNADNDRYSFSCAWGDSNSNGLPDLFVANDFGSSQLYRNKGDGQFEVASKQSHVEDVGARMGCAWCDYDNDGRQDIYVPSMWEAAGQRVAGQKQFHADAPASIRELYRRHARGNALYRNQGDGTFRNQGHDAGVEMGRWSWSSDFWDIDNDGFSDLYVANGYLSAPDRDDMAGFFWRQVVAKSPEDASPAPAYERGWNAINELVRSDHTWHGYARNVSFVNNRNGTFAEISGAIGLDCLEDSRAFALADIDHDGRLEVIVKNRNAPQLRVLRNALPQIGRAVAFRLRGSKSNRDAIGASVTLEAVSLKQTKYLQAGSGFLSQHAKELFFGVGDEAGPFRATVRWPSGATQTFDRVPADHSIALEEGVETFSARAFSQAPPAYAQPVPEPAIDALPTRVATWLVQPLRAPDFSLPDTTGATRHLSEWAGRETLLTFWSMNAPDSLEQIRRLQGDAAATAATSLRIVAINLDDDGSGQAARSHAAQYNRAFPVLFATEETAGIYNLIYRYLFDRRRDLPIPCSFLLDREGRIVRVYQGLLDPRELAADASAVASGHAGNPLPFPGDLHLGTFRRNDYTYGVAMFQHGYLDQAAESFRQVIAAKPDDPDAWYNLGTLSLARNNFDEAQRALKKTVELDRANPEAWNNLGMLAAQQGRLDEAVTDFEQSLALRPSYAVALLNLGNVYRRQRLFDKAEQSLSRALALEPDNPEIDFSLGMLYAQQNQLDDATGYLRKAIAARPDYPEALNNLGVVMVRRQDYAAAEEQFKTGIRVAPQFDQSYLNLARLYAMQNDREKAKAILSDLLRLQPENATAKQAMETLQ